ncbi:MAG: hypothetical protein M0Z55_11160 [Peptococcaceae bacterium]|nr:hypothetical protein [Peptococcaceae bacterium]
MFRIPLYELQIFDVGACQTHTLYTEMSWQEVVINWLQLRHEGYQVYIVRDQKQR